MKNIFMNSVYQPEEEKQDIYVETVKNVQLARAYVPFQQWEKLYAPEVGLEKGTIFPSLNQPHF